MFGKIKNRLKNVFQASEEVIEDKIEENSTIIKEEIKEPEKKSFLNKIFTKKDKIEEQEIESLEESLLENVDKKEIESIHNKKNLNKETIIKNKQNLEKQIKKENILEKQVLNDIEDKNLNEEDNKEGFLSKTFKKLKSKEINNDDFDKIWIELQIFLLEINIAYEIVEKIETKLRDELISKSFDRFKLSQKIREVLENEIEIVLKTRESNLIEKINQIKQENNQPVKILILGVNGTGKTTSIAKIVNYFKKNNLTVVVAAADTFRAAATEQLEEHSKKLGFKLIMHKGGSDPAAVAFDSIEHAKAKNLDIVLIDTAGRMPNNSNLMSELLKIKRVSKSDLNIFIGDSISGNDLIEQIELFEKGVGIDGIILTKVDTDEKPGSIVSTAYKIEKPIYFLGIGQEYEDLIKFDSKEISKKLFEIEE